MEFVPTTNTIASLGASLLALFLSLNAAPAQETGRNPAAPPDNTPTADKASHNDPESQLTLERPDQGVLGLYFHDGLILFPRGLSGVQAGGPTFSFISINNFGITLSDFDRVDDTRSLASDALFAESKTTKIHTGRLGSLLTPNELRGMIRGQDRLETFERLRMRLGDWLAVDFFYRHRDDERAQITNYFLPDKFNTVRVNEYGVSLNHTFDFDSSHDSGLYLAGGYSRVVEEGLIEFIPLATETIDQYQTEAKLFGPIESNPASADFTFVYQGIHQDISKYSAPLKKGVPPAYPYARNRIIGALTLDYGLAISQAGASNDYTLQRLDFFTGASFDNEAYGPIDTRKKDVFLGVTAQTPKLDITLQPTFFRGSVDDDPTEDNSQYRTNLTFLYRVFDEERGIGSWSGNLGGVQPAFFDIALPLRDDLMLSGPKQFENYRVGIALRTKLVRSPAALANNGKTTIRPADPGAGVLASIQYDYEDFYRLHKGENLVSVNLSIGF
jgi:hypothetical protein